MIKINDRNINDVFKDEDIIEKYSDVLSVLYAVFLKINDIEKSIESMVRFVEALTLFLRLNSSSLLSREQIPIELIIRYLAGKSLSNGEALKIYELVDDSDYEEYFKRNVFYIKKELYYYAECIYNAEKPIDYFGEYIEHLINCQLQALNSYKGDTPLTNEILLTLYYASEELSITNVFKYNGDSKFFSEEESKWLFLNPTKEI
ncbi:MAG: hypothetical protein IJ470_05010 [Clostridia bacterium]|nr:hypothetical protein [Clostridia bacterium]